MNKHEIGEIVACLPKGRTRFYYFKDRYALMLLSLALDAPKSANEIRRTGFARLLNKPLLKELMAAQGSGKVSRGLVDSYWPTAYECYLLSVGMWGSRDRRYDQTSRTGYNLVLQLNFSEQHDRKYRSLITNDDLSPFVEYAHPVRRKDRNTLAWSRLDIDMKRGVALIEEVQNDWIRYALRALERAQQQGGSYRFFQVDLRSARLRKYIDTVLAPHIKTWDEAMLAATIWFLRVELGIQEIYYHTFKTGAFLKAMKHQLPPKSLYTTLPSKFCFKETEEWPEFLLRKPKCRRARKMINRARFQVLDWQ